MTDYTEYSSNSKEAYVYDNGKNYYICQSIKPDSQGYYKYNLYNYDDVIVATWKDKANSIGLSEADFLASENGKTFMKQASQNSKKQKEKKNFYQASLWDLDDDEEFVYGDEKVSDDDNYFSFGYDDKDYKPKYDYHWEPSKKSTGFLGKLNKSDTLVIHCEDKSTDMLSQIYTGKNWDVLRDGNIDKDELHQLMTSHDKIVCLGHGTPSGLLNKQGWGYVIGDEEAEYFKGKKIFAIWCYASSYFEKHNIGQGCFITTNLPSEKWESSAAGCGNITSELMLENITYWSKLCANICEDCLQGNAINRVEYLRKNYLEQYGNHPVSVFNALGSLCLGKKAELPKYTFKGKPLEPKDYPVPNFDEAAFLLNPTPKASECPTLKINEDLNIAAPYMLRNDGEFKECAPMHPYIKFIFEDSERCLDKLSDERFSSLVWFYKNTNKLKTRLNIEIIVKYLLTKGMTTIEKCKVFNITDETYNCSEEEIAGFLDTLNADTNQEFLRVRTSNLLFGGHGNEIFFRISSIRFNWFDLIWSLVYKYRNNITTITICKDTNTFGGKFEPYIVGGTTIKDLPINDFINLNGNPVIEKLDATELPAILEANKNLQAGKTLSEAYNYLHPRYVFGFYERQIEKYLNKDINNILVKSDKNHK